MLYEHRSRARPDFVIAVSRPLRSIDAQPTEDEVREAVSADTKESEIAVICSEGWDRIPSRTSWAQAPGYHAGGKGSPGGFNPGRR